MYFIAQYYKYMYVNLWQATASQAMVLLYCFVHGLCTQEIKIWLKERLNNVAIHHTMYMQHFFLIFFFFFFFFNQSSIQTWNAHQVPIAYKFCRRKTLAILTGFLFFLLQCKVNGKLCLPELASYFSGKSFMECAPGVHQVYSHARQRLVLGPFTLPCQLRDIRKIATFRCKLPSNYA